jgi:hypothetical protein
MIDTNELVLVTFGFNTIEDWKNDKNFGKKTPEELMKLLRYKSFEDWEKAVMPLHREIKVRILAALGRLWQAIGKPINKEQMQVYYHTFANYPPDVVERGVESILKTHRYSNIPTLADLIESMK